MSIFSRHPKDYVGKWFEQRRKLGLSDTIHWARYSPETDCLKFDKFQHANGDGLSIIKHLLTETGYGHIKLPTCKENGLPTKKRLISIKKNSQAYPKKINWLFWKTDRSLSENLLVALSFSKEDTTRIEQRAQSLNIPIATLVLWALNRAVAKNLLEKKQEYTWMYPVNLRGAVTLDTDYANYSSGFYLPVTEDISIQDLQQRIRQKLKSGEHWINWQQANIARYLPGIVIRWIYKFISKRYYYAGNFSAMGNWFSQEDLTSETASPQEIIDKELWFGFAPGTKNYPVSASSITWSDQLVLTLKLHSSIIKNNNTTVETIFAWGEGLLENFIISPEEAKKQKRLITYSYSPSAT